MMAYLMQRDGVPNATWCGVQVLCASVVHRPTFYEDDLVHNYLQFARRRFDELNLLRQRQCDEMRRRMSTDLATSL